MSLLWFSGAVIAAVADNGFWYTAFFVGMAQFWYGVSLLVEDKP